MNRFVLDASVAVAWVEARRYDHLCGRRSIACGERVARVVPPLWQLEVANGLLMNERRRTLTSAEADRGLLDLETFLASLAELDTTPAAMREMAKSRACIN